MALTTSIELYQSFEENKVLICGEWTNVDTKMKLLVGSVWNCCFQVSIRFLCWTRAVRIQSLTFASWCFTDVPRILPWTGLPLKYSWILPLKHGKVCFILAATIFMLLLSLLCKDYITSVPMKYLNYLHNNDVQMH